jgi:hypothetical protein
MPGREQGRVRRRQYGMRAGMPLAVVLLLIACTGAPSGSPTVAPPTGDPLRVLATDLSSGFEEPFSVAAATDQAEYEELWQRLDAPPPAPPVDFEQELVLFLGMAGSSSCPERFAQLVVDTGPRVYARWQPHPAGQACTDDLAPQGVLLAVSRSELPAEPFLLSLREAPICADCAEHPDQRIVDPG